MNPAIILALLPLIEAALNEAPQMIADVKNIIAAIEGKATTPTASNPAATMADADAKLAARKNG